MIPLLILGAVALGLLSALAYAIWGKPSSAASKKRQQQVVSGFALAGWILLGALLGGSLVIGIGIAFFGVESSRISSRPLAFALAAVSFAAIALLVQRWAKYFAGWMAWSVLNALMMASSGHVLDNPSVSVKRSVALTMAGLMVVTVSTTIRFAGPYKLNAVDRAALLLWVLAFAVGANMNLFPLAAITVGCAGLFVAWVYDKHLRQHSSSKKRKHLVAESH